MKRIHVCLMLCICCMLMAVGCAKKPAAPDAIRVAALKGPTTMGLVGMMSENLLGDYQEKTSFTMKTAADEIVAAVVKNEVDIALVPANVASVLYSKTEGGVKVIDINTLGVLYVVAKDDSIQSMADLKGKTLYMTGKGTTPDLALQFLLAKNGMTTDDIHVEYCAEATEVVSRMAEDDSTIGLLPQPFVTTVLMKDETMKIVLDLTAEWNKVADDSQLLTGVTIVRKEFAEQYGEVVNAFIEAHEKSVQMGKDNLDKTAQRIEEQDIVKAPVAKKAYEACHIVCISGAEMKTALQGYLKALFDLQPTAVGGKLPEEDFYYTR